MPQSTKSNIALVREYEQLPDNAFVAVCKLVTSTTKPDTSGKALLRERNKLQNTLNEQPELIPHVVNQITCVAEENKCDKNILASAAKELLEMDCFAKDNTHAKHLGDLIKVLESGRPPSSPDKNQRHIVISSLYRTSPLNR